MLYDGTRTGHRSCGIALAEAAGVATAPYQSLRRGGLTGQGPCGAVTAGRLLLGERLGDPSPTGGVTPALRRAITVYDARVAAELDRGGVASWICADLTAPHGEFTGPARHRFCTRLVGQVAQLVDEVLRDEGVVLVPTPVVLDDGASFDPHADAPPPELLTPSLPEP